MKRRGKTIALSAVAVGLVVLVAAGIVSKDRILEKWYLHQLETGTPEAKEQALQILAKVGSEESLMKLEEYRLHDAPVIIFRWGLPGHEGSKVVPVPKADVVIKRVLPSGGGVDRAGRVVVEIRERIGKARARAAVRKYIRDPKGDERTRVREAQLVILITVPPEILPEIFRQPDALNYPPPGSQELKDLLDVKPAAIQVLIQALSSGDHFCREGSAFALSLCGPEAVAAIPALKAALTDPEEMVSEAVAAALKRIQVTRDETER